MKNDLVHKSKQPTSDKKVKKSLRWSLGKKRSLWVTSTYRNDNCGLITYEEMSDKMI